MKTHEGGERTTERPNNSQSSQKELGEFTVPKEERTKINDLSFHLKKLESEEQIKLRVSRRNEAIYIKAGINKTQNEKQQRNTADS